MVVEFLKQTTKFELVRNSINDYAIFAHQTSSLQHSPEKTRESGIIYGALVTSSKLNRKH